MCSGSLTPLRQLGEGTTGDFLERGGTVWTRILLSMLESECFCLVQLVEDLQSVCKHPQRASGGGFNCSLDDFIAIRNK